MSQRANPHLTVVHHPPAPRPVRDVDASVIPIWPGRSFAGRGPRRDWPYCYPEFGANSAPYFRGAGWGREPRIVCPGTFGYIVV
jgi:hypothetical protein